jgi:hypothetical protein
VRTRRSDLAHIAPTQWKIRKILAKNENDVQFASRNRRVARGRAAPRANPLESRMSPRTGSKAERAEEFEGFGAPPLGRCETRAARHVAPVAELAYGDKAAADRVVEP